ncbi:isoprenoid synthase domain-containing protein [Pisolithus orientalis]|uniref:isoprenoid synthase domain-containing protein n=1 Tax=Pisolithus orientalis TaxID=936130 RepID=UPI0022248FCB|nr:isoprenoid synthase domain-containing protein [Pisolithus orientalis]KAI6028505.1 isoprenoid synthase domain-containing protein [Pisolithus orientalis]
MVAQTYQLPDLLSFFAQKPGGPISPHFKGAYQGYSEWVGNTLGYYFSIEVYNAEMPLLAALAYPLATEHELRAILDYMTASFMLEEMTDRYSSSKALKNSEIWMQTLKGGQPETSTRHPFIKLMSKEMMTRLKSAVDPFHWPQFISTNVDFARNTVREALDREASKGLHATRDLHSYMITRRETIGTRPCLVLMRSTRRLYIPDSVLENNAVMGMENAALDMVYIANDIYSFKKEQGDNGALNNIITVILKDPDTSHLDLQGAINYAGDLFKAALDDFHACRGRIPSFGTEMDKFLSAYGDGLIDWAIGNIEWSVVNNRYKVFCNDSDRRSNVIRLGNRHNLHVRPVICFILLIVFIFVYSHNPTLRLTHMPRCLSPSFSSSFGL